MREVIAWRCFFTLKNLLENRLSQSPFSFIIITYYHKKSRVKMKFANDESEKNIMTDSFSLEFDQEKLANQKQGYFKDKSS